MVYTRRNVAEEREEAHRKAEQLAALCTQWSIALDPIDWQNNGMLAPVTVSTLKIANLSDLRRLDSTSTLRLFQMKLFEQAALNTIRAQPDLKASMWLPIEVIQPQEFLCLWVVMLESNERIAIAEYLRNGQRVYEHFAFAVNDDRALAKLFGPAYTGEYARGDRVTIEAHGRQHSGEIISSIYPSKLSAQGKYSSRERHSTSGKVYPNETSPRYVVDCHDGFPHIANRWQITGKTDEG